MAKLNLTANGSEQQILLEHLTPLISDVLAEKINNGVTIEKDGKQLLSKKTLDTLMNYLSEQAKNKIPEKERHGKKYVCMEGADILNYAIHYFEEDSIEGKLYNADGTEYKVEPKVQPKPVTPIKPAAPTPPKPQLNIFDMLSNDTEQPAETPPNPVVIQPEPEQKKGSPTYQHYLTVKEKYKNCLLFYRLGDFYELFNGDAVTAADMLNLTLTGRDFGLAERVPMVGVPFHAVEPYIKKLVNNGYKVAVCERLDGNTERTVERVIAPEPTEVEQLDDDYEDLNEDEMRKFDGDITEPAEPAEQPDDEGFDLVTEKERLKAFDTQALCLLGELFNNEIDIQ